MSSSEPSSSAAAPVPSEGAAPPPSGDGDVAMAAPAEPEEEPLPADILNATPEEIATRTRLLENDIKVMRSEHMRLTHEQGSMREKIKDNADKIKQNKVLPYLVGNVVEVSW